MEKQNKPEVLYRGVRVNYLEFERMILGGESIKPYYPPKINKEGRKVVGDGNEYGVYMTTNKSMVETAYGNPRSDNKVLFDDIELGSNPPLKIGMPNVGVVFEINTNNMDVREPWICSSLQGHYNNGFEGEEWIADEIPANNYRVMKVQLARDLVHDSQVIEAKNMNYEEFRQVVMSVLNSRKKRLTDFANAVRQISPLKRKIIERNSCQMRCFTKLFGNKGLAYMDSVEARDLNDLFDYLIMVEYKKNKNNIDFNKMFEVENFRTLISSDPSFKNFGKIEDTLNKRIEKVLENREKCMRVQPVDNQKLERFNDLYGNLVSILETFEKAKKIFIESVEKKQTKTAGVR